MIYGNLDCYAVHVLRILDLDFSKTVLSSILEKMFDVKKTASNGIQTKDFQHLHLVPIYLSNAAAQLQPPGIESYQVFKCRIIQEIEIYPNQITN